MTTDVLVKGVEVASYPGVLVDDGTRGPWVQFPGGPNDMLWPSDRVPVVASLRPEPTGRLDEIVHVTFGTPGTVGYWDYKMVLNPPANDHHEPVDVPGHEVSWTAHQGPDGWRPVGPTIRVRAGHRVVGGPPAYRVVVTHPELGRAVWCDNGRVLEGDATKAWPEKVQRALRTAAWVSHTARDVLQAWRTEAAAVARAEAEAEAERDRARLLSLL